MNATKMNKMLALYRSGLLSASEIAQSFVFDAVTANEREASLLSFFGNLPIDIRDAVCQLLHKIRHDDFKWTPFLLTTSGEFVRPENYDERLRTVCEELLTICTSATEERA